MSQIAFLIPIALLLGLVGLGAFLWALRSGQFDDLDGAAWRILQDDEDTPPTDQKDDDGDAAKPRDPRREPN